ncbi:MAG: phosphoribosylformylglycinamidine synthase subunit PurS [Candidatus Omnitrophica bacterium]|nr:phosphoribosylformylglycinamidine synthase subunit PurS [Candidatus Omnitrophota bacterium]
MYNAKINVTLKKSVLDPQGQTILHALESLGFKDVKKVRVGKFFELLIEACDRKTAEEKIKEMCHQLLINPVIEEYTFEMGEVK